MIRYSALKAVPPARLRRWLGRLVVLLQGVSFWSAVVLPFLYLPILTVDPARPLVLVGVLALNVAALVVGHGYDGWRLPDTSGRRSNA